VNLNDSSLLKQSCYINGEWLNAPDGAATDVTNPADGSVIGTVPALGAEETRAAIDAADASWRAWRSKTGKERCNILRGWFNLIMENQKDLAAS
jgi:succinate-semialdehyde dehydrogenase/glutarate-semialdehyde dehydrogenase